MTRESDNVYNADGDLIHGYDYRLQCWVEAGVIQDCGHPKGMACGCVGRVYAGHKWGTMERRDRERKQ